MKQSVVLLVFFLLVSGFAAAQDAPPPPSAPVQCGDVVERDFVERDDLETSGQTIWFRLDAAPGTRVTLEGHVPGETLTLSLAVFDPAYDLFAQTASWDEESQSATLETPALTSRGTHWLGVVNTAGVTNANLQQVMDAGSEGYPTLYGSLGYFILSITCELPSGEVIAPGSATAPGAGGQTLLLPTQVPATVVPFVLNTPTSATVVPGSTDLIGYAVEAPAEGSLRLTLTRVSGTASTGVLVIAPDGSIAFQTTMIATPTVSAQINPVMAGPYVVVAFPLDFAQPDDAQPAAIQIDAQME